MNEPDICFTRVLGKASWRKHNGGGIMEEASWRREASRRSILKASGRRLGASGKHLGDVWGTLQGSRNMKK